MQKLDEQPKLESFEAELNRLDPELLDFYVDKLKSQIDLIQTGDKVGVAFHPDADGICSGTFIIAYLKAKFGAQIEIIPINYELDTEPFGDVASHCDHIITTDCWITATEKGQEPLQNTMEQGINVTTIDHHDSRFGDQDIRKTPPYSAERDPHFPETIAENREGSTSGRFCFISPKRLGTSMRDTNKYPATLVTYKLLTELLKKHEPEPFMQDILQKLEFLLPIGVAGDNSLDEWPNLAEKHEANSETIKRLATLLNLAENFGSPINVVNTLLNTSISEEDPIPTIEQRSREIQAAARIQEWIETESPKIQWDQQKQPILFHHHIGEEEVARASEYAREQFADVLQERINPNIGIANETSKLIGKKVMIVISQYFTNSTGQPPSIALSLRSEKAGMDTRTIARIFGGGGHSMASGARILIHAGTDPQEIINEIKGIVRMTNNPGH
jgi:hypothetical protein